MNLTILIGNLTDDPKMATTGSGIPVCTFRLAVQRRFANAQGKREADFFNIVAWRQLGELCGRYLSKGRKCMVKGSLQTRSYDAQDGSKRYVTEVVADEVEFLSSGAKDNPSGLTATSPYTGEAGNAEQGAFVQVDDDEMPF